jgi:2-dehydro-3-deoxyphosphogluconate aldolase/(4S)-4-hydroxy-2-oxoglutarate aldolase
MRLLDALQPKPVIPLIEADDAASGLAAARALGAAGIAVVEVVQRTDASLACLRAVAGALPDLVVGAGTVLSADQATACLDAGAQFVVSPGLDPDVVAATSARGCVAIPGVMTPTEVQLALKLGLDLVKFFPAATAGGVGALRALASVFRDIRFIPTGGISASNLPGYLALECVTACGGSWMTPKDAIASGDCARIGALAADALAIAASARGS